MDWRSRGPGRGPSDGLSAVHRGHSVHTVAPSVQAERPGSEAGFFNPWVQGSIRWRPTSGNIAFAILWVMSTDPRRACYRHGAECRRCNRAGLKRGLRVTVRAGSDPAHRKTDSAANDREDGEQAQAELTRFSGRRVLSVAEWLRRLWDDGDLTGVALIGQAVRIIGFVEAEAVRDDAFGMEVP